MHAASVHPEPGSNSRIIVLKSPSWVFQSLRAFFLSFFYFCLSSILFQNFTRSFFRTIFLLSLCTSSISCCSIFNDQFAAFKIYSFVIISQTPYACQVLFLSFLNFFSCSLTLAFATLLYYHICSLLSIPFFKVFSLFSKYFLKSIQCDCQ